jgi:hypothetical protein
MSEHRKNPSMGHSPSKDHIERGHVRTWKKSGQGRDTHFLESTVEKDKLEHGKNQSEQGALTF